MDPLAAFDAYWKGRGFLCQPTLMQRELIHTCLLNMHAQDGRLVHLLQGPKRIGKTTAVLMLALYCHEVLHKKVTVLAAAGKANALRIQRSILPGIMRTTAPTTPGIVTFDVLSPAETRGISPNLLIVDDIQCDKTGEIEKNIVLPLELMKDVQILRVARYHTNYDCPRIVEEDRGIFPPRSRCLCTHATLLNLETGEYDMNGPDDSLAASFGELRLAASSGELRLATPPWHARAPHRGPLLKPVHELPMPMEDD